MDKNYTLRRRLLAALRKADHDFGLIDEKDRILIGLSGGKDSMVLLDLLSIYRRFKDKDFEIAAIHLDFGFPFVDFTPVEEYVEKLGVKYIKVEEKEVYEILSRNRTSSGLLPCSICSRMRKAIVNKRAKEYGYSKVAFAHHMDDAIETLFLNMMYGGRVATFQPKMHLEKADIRFIRPLVYCREDDLSKYVRKYEIPVCKNSCGNDKKTQREYVKEMLSRIYKDAPDAYNNFAAMLTNSDTFSLFFDQYGANEDSLFIKKCCTKEDILAVANIAKKTESTDSFDYENCLYYVLRREGTPLAYIKAEVKEDFSVNILLLEITEGCKKEWCTKLIDVFEKELSMIHVPRDITYMGERNRDIFIDFGYTKKDGTLTKKINKAMKL